MRLGRVTKFVLGGAFALLAIAGLCVASFSSAVANDGISSQKPIQLAQLKFEFGGGEREMIRHLRRSGYSEIQVVDSGISKVRVQACFEGSRYDVKVKRFTGKITRVSKIGECRPVLDERQVVQRLRSEGFRRISLYASDADQFRLIACKRGKRFRMTLNIYGDVLLQDAVGKCQDRLTVAEIRHGLHDKGYNRLKLLREDNKVYVFEGCERRDQVRLRVRKNGVVARKRVTGSCTPPISFKKIPDIMGRLGFDRIAVTDRNLPVYVAEGCTVRSQRISVRFNRFGDELDRKRVGDCEPPLTEADVVNLIREGGANRILVEVDRGGNFVATSCHGLKKYRSRFDKYGKLFDQRSVGKCAPAPRLNQIVDKFEGRDLANPQVYVEGCRKGRRIRIHIDEFGDVLDRERLGSCR